jgi:hypothetical protein
MRSVVVLAVGVLVAVLAPATAQAHDDGVKTIASGLDNPRGLAFDEDGSLYVAEAGRGGAEACMPGPEGGEVCFGTSGAITEISRGKQQRVLSGLPSLAKKDAGTEAIGPSDVAFKDDSMLFTVGLGANPAVRATMPPEGQNLGWLLRSSEREKVDRVADIAGYEATANPDGSLEPDSNPNSLLVTGSSTVVADAGGNSLVSVSRSGKVSTIAVFPSQPISVPNAPPEMQAVPTSVVRGPDGAYYVGQLTGFPFLVGAAKVYRVVPGQDPTVFADGFTNIIDIGFDRSGSLYVLEIAHNGLASGNPAGALFKVRRNGTHQTVLDKGLITPSGLALKDGYAYVSNCGTCPGEGSVLRVPLG